MTNPNIPKDYEPAPPVNNLTAPAHSFLSNAQKEEIVELAESSHRDVSGGRSNLGSEEYTRGDTTRSGGNTSTGGFSSTTTGTHGHHHTGLGDNSASSYSTSATTGSSGLAGLDTTGHAPVHDQRSAGTKIKDAILPGQGHDSAAGTGVGHLSSTGDKHITSGTTGEYGNTGRGDYSSGIGSGTHEAAGRGIGGAGATGAGLAGAAGAAGLAHSHHSQSTSSGSAGYDTNLGGTSANSYGRAGADVASTGPGIPSNSAGVYETSRGTGRGDGLTGSTAGSTLGSSGHGVGTAAAGVGAGAGIGAAGLGHSQYQSGSQHGGRKEELQQLSGQSTSSSSSGNKYADELARNAHKAGTSARGFGTHGQGV